jgi:hypothetical protein
MRQWNVVRAVAEAPNVKVFSGGACNILDANGKLLRNTERDAVNDWLTQRGITFFDPQIHPDTHGYEYDYAMHHPLEVAVRKAAAINLFEVSPRTFGGVTSMEVAVDQFRRGQPVIIFFSDGEHQRDVIPRHSPEGYPLFVPYGIHDDAAAQRAHYREFIKNANRMRQHLLRFAQDMNGLTVTFGNQVYDGDVVITPERMHAVEMFQAVVNASLGKRVMVNFTGGEAARDKNDHPIMRVPDEPRPMELKALLDQYVDEGNALRKAICELVHINVYVRVTYTQHTTIASLTDLLRLKGLLVS